MTTFSSPQNFVVNTPINSFFLPRKVVYFRNGRKKMDIVMEDEQEATPQASSSFEEILTMDEGFLNMSLSTPFEGSYGLTDSSAVQNPNILHTPDEMISKGTITGNESVSDSKPDHPKKPKAGAKRRGRKPKNPESLGPRMESPKDSNIEVLKTTEGSDLAKKSLEGIDLDTLMKGIDTSSRRDPGEKLNLQGESLKTKSTEELMKEHTVPPKNKKRRRNKKKKLFETETMEKLETSDTESVFERKVTQLCQDIERSNFEFSTQPSTSGASYMPQFPPEERENRRRESRESQGKGSKKNLKGRMKELASTIDEIDAIIAKEIAKKDEYKKKGYKITHSLLTCLEKEQEMRK